MLRDLERHYKEGRMPKEEYEMHKKNIKEE